ncbi:MAG TPA: hypothetical protein VFC33_08235 [Acidimicrobiia bacterium]|nr:hypothetical protein [Acidimicrobiia bacterium]
MTSRIEHAAVGLRSWSRRHAGPLAAVAFALFVGLCVVAAHEYSSLHLHPDLWLLAPAAIGGTAVMVVLNALEYASAAVIAHHRPSPREAVTVSVAGSTANLLPLPGAFLVRNYALLSAGVTFEGAMGGTVATSLAWLGITALVVGAIAAPVDLALGIPVVIVGLLLCAIFVLLVRRRLDARATRHLVAALFAVELVTVGVEIGRYWLVLAAVGAHPTLIRTLPFVSANVVAAASIVFPGGLGVREALAGGFSTAANLPAAVGFAVSAADRVSVTLVYAVLAALLALERRARRVVTVPARVRIQEGQSA